MAESTTANGSSSSSNSSEYWGPSAWGSSFGGEYPVPTMPDPGPFEAAFRTTVDIGGVPVPVTDLVLSALGAVWVLFVMVRASRMARVTRANTGSAIVLLPCYIWLLRATAFAVIVRAGLGMFVAVYVYPAETLYDVLWFYSIQVALASICTSLYRLPTEGLTFFLMQHTGGTRAIKRAFAGALFSALLSYDWPSTVLISVARAEYVDEFTPYVWLDLTDWIKAWYCCVYIFLGGLYYLAWLAPTKWFYRRPALLPFAAFWAIEITIGAVAAVVAVYELDVRFLLYLIQDIVYYVGGPAAAYQAMVSDSLFWQGYHPAERSAIGNLIAPLDGIRLTVASAVSLTAQVDRLTTTCPVTQLNFRYLKLQTDKVLGVGAQARVYRGVYKDRPVAIKVVFCIELTPEIVSDFCNEARLLTLMAHPNIVETVGVCVVPPTIAIVMELCERGSLANVLQSDLSMPWRLKLAMCRDCIRGVEFLHSRDAVHQDIKSMNYLVTSNLTVKLTDLGVSDDSTTVAPAASTANTPTAFRGTLQWAAPEVLSGKPYTPASDVYSLTIVLWEIAARRLPFDTSDVRRLLPPQLTDAVRGIGAWQMYPSASAADGGLRPPMPTNIPADFVSMLRVGWSAIPAARPTARELLANVEGMLARQGPSDTPHVAKFADTIDYSRLSMTSQPIRARLSNSEWTANPLVSAQDAV